MHRFFAVPLVCFVVPAACLAAGAPAVDPLATPFTTLPGAAGFQFEPATPWLSAGNGTTDNHWAQGEFILNPYTLPYLTERWVFSANGEVQGVPTVENGRVYVADNGGTVSQLDATTGQAIWQASLPALSGDPLANSRNSPAIAPNTVIVGDQDSATVYALSKTDGSLAWKTVLDTSQGAIVTSSPVIVNGVIYVGVASEQENLASRIANFVPTFRGSVAALDENTGRILWQTYTVPSGYTGGGVWASNLAVDASRSAVYVTTGDNYSVPPSVLSCQISATSPAQEGACLSPNDHIDSVLSLNMNTGAVNWANRFTNGDTWTTSCETYRTTPAATPCPNPASLDTDFGAGANLFTITSNGAQVDVVGAGQKSGSYYAMNRDTGAMIWATNAGPDGVIGGIQWGAATDNQRIYFSEANSGYVPTKLLSGATTNGGFWAALDKNTGKILWQTPTILPAVNGSGNRIPPPPASGAPATGGGSVSVAAGVMYREDNSGDFVALNAVTGQVLRTFNSGGAGISAPSIVDGVLYWASGYSANGPTNNKVYAFWIGLQ